MKALPMFVVLASCTLLGCTQRGSQDTESNYADPVFRNGAVYTMDDNRSWATAVAVRKDKIVYVGFEEGVDAVKRLIVRNRRPDL